MAARFPPGKAAWISCAFIGTRKWSNLISWSWAWTARLHYLPCLQSSCNVVRAQEHASVSDGCACGRTRITIYYSTADFCKRKEASCIWTVHSNFVQHTVFCILVLHFQTPVTSLYSKWTLSVIRSGVTEDPTSMCGQIPSHSTKFFKYGICSQTYIQPYPHMHTHDQTHTQMYVCTLAHTDSKLPRAQRITDRM